MGYLLSFVRKFKKVLLTLAFLASSYLAYLSIKTLILTNAPTNEIIRFIVIFVLAHLFVISFYITIKEIELEKRNRGLIHKLEKINDDITERFGDG